MKNVVERLVQYIRGNRLSLLALVILLLGTYAAWQSAMRYERQKQQLDFENLSKIHLVSLQQKLGAYVRELLALRNQFAHRNIVTQGDFSNDLASLDIKKNYPGLRSLTYARLVKPSEKVAHERFMHEMGLSHYEIKPEGQRAQYFPTILIDPADPELLKTTLGFDGFSSALRRPAMEKARDNDQPVMSERLTLNSDLSKSSIYVVYLPVYRSDSPHSSIAERRQALQGFLAAAFDAETLLNEEFGKDFLRVADIAVFDKGRPSVENLIYASNVGQASLTSQPSFRDTLPIGVADRNWLLQFFSRPAFNEETKSYLPLGILVAGGFLVIGLLIYLSHKTKRQKREYEQQMVQQSYRALFDQNADAAFLLDLQGRFLNANNAFLALVALSREDLSGRTLAQLIAVDALDAHDHHVKDAVNGHPQHYDSVIISKTEDRVEVNISLFAVTVKGCVLGLAGIVKNITERKQHEHRLSYLARFDALTGLVNRTSLHERLNEAISHFNPDGGILALMFLDLDRFKEINDTMGHATGDEVLKTVAQRIQGCFRKEDIIARLGGDEYCVLLEGLPDADQAKLGAEKIVDAFAKPFHLSKKDIFLTTSIGIAVYPHDANDAEALIKAADLAMYYAKTHGKNNYQFYSKEIADQESEQLSMKHQLSRALERQEFVLYYQPQVDIQTGEVFGVEALLRWRHPYFGLITPGNFIRLAENTGLVVPINMWVLKTACNQLSKWHRQGYETLTVSVNIAPEQFKQYNFVETIRKALEEVELTPGYLVLEITEAILMEDIHRSTQVLKSIDSLGVQISINNFGAYSSLSHLPSLPLDIIKIDRSFIGNLSSSKFNETMAEAIISLAHSLDVKVIAEGIETEQQADFLRQKKSEGGQGFYFGQPMPPENLVEVLSSRLSFKKKVH